MPLYVVTRRQGTQADPAPKVRLIKAARHVQVEQHLMKEVTIERATAEQTHQLAKQGVDVEEVAAT